MVWIFWPSWWLSHVEWKHVQVWDHQEIFGLIENWRFELFRWTEFHCFTLQSSNLWICQFILGLVARFKALSMDLRWSIESIGTTLSCSRLIKPFIFCFKWVAIPILAFIIVWAVSPLFFLWQYYLCPTARLAYAMHKYNTGQHGSICLRTVNSAWANFSLRVQTWPVVCWVRSIFPEQFEFSLKIKFFLVKSEFSLEIKLF